MASRRGRVPPDSIRRAIVLVRGQRVMLDADLAALYRVPTKALVQAVRRNSSRFPEDFMFRLTSREAARLRSQFVTSNVRQGRGGRRFLPYAFTEHGVAMLSSVLRSQRAIDVNIAIMRTFVRLRRISLSHEELARKLSALERKYDSQFRGVFDAIRQLMSTPVSERSAIGFRPRPNAEPTSASQATRRRRGPSPTRGRHPSATAALS